METQLKQNETNLASLIEAASEAVETMKNIRIIVYKDGSWKQTSNATWEYENDPDWLTTISFKTQP